MGGDIANASSGTTVIRIRWQNIRRKKFPPISSKRKPPLARYREPPKIVVPPFPLVLVNETEKATDPRGNESEMVFGVEKQVFGVLHRKGESPR